MIYLVRRVGSPPPRIYGGQSVVLGEWRSVRSTVTRGVTDLMKPGRNHGGRSIALGRWTVLVAVAIALLVCVAIIPAGSSALPTPIDKGPAAAAGRGVSLANPALPTDPSPSIADNPSSGQVSSEVNVTGSGFAPSTALLLNFSTTPITSCAHGSLTSDPAGNFSCMFRVPAFTAGKYPINVTDEVNNATVNYTILSPTLQLSPTSGFVGSRVTATGEGFDPSTKLTLKAAGVHQTSCKSGSLESDSTGNFTCAFDFPSAPAGSKAVSLNDSFNTATATFTLNGSTLLITPTSGIVGTPVQATGVGYIPSHALTVTFGSKTIGGCSSGSLDANASGDLNCTFPVPAVPSGSYLVNATDGTNPAPSQSFTVGANISLDPESGALGASVVVSGTGFDVSASVSVSWNATTSLCSANANTTGGFSCTFSVPTAAAGPHPVNATQGSNTPSATFRVLPSASVNPTVGNVASPVTAKAYDFDAGQSLTVYWDHTTSLCSGTTNTNGGFACSFAVPASPGGAHSVDFEEGSYDVAESFTVTTAFSIAPISGAVGTTVALTGTGFAASTSYAACMQTTISSCASGTLFTTAANGSIPAGTTFEVPSLAPGSYYLDVSTGGTVTADASFLVTAAALTATPASADVGSPVSLSGSGYVPSTAYAYCFESSAAACPSGTPTEFVSTASGDIPSGVGFSVPETPGGHYFVDVSSGSSLLASAGFTVEASAEGNLTTGTVGTSVTASGTGFDASSSYSVEWNGTTEVCGGTTNLTGGFSCEFTVPSSPAGSHPLVAKEGANAPTFSFVIVPSILVAPMSGPVGTEVALTGQGFDVNSQVSVSWGTSGSVCSGSSNGLGVFSCAFSVPTAVAGAHTVTAFEGTYSPTASFTVVPSVSVNPSSGSVGSSANLTGAGFDALAHYVALWDASGSLCNGTTSAQGAFQCSILVPSSAAGVHTIEVVEGTYTPAADFTVNASVSVSPGSGTVGSSVTLVATGLSSGSSYAVDWNQTSTMCTGVVPTDGRISCAILVPSTPAGSHAVAVEVAGGGYTADFTILPSVSLSVASGTVGTEVRAVGEGFDANASFYVTWNATASLCLGTSNSVGNLVCSFPVPNAPGGAHSVTVVEGSNSPSVAFTVLPSVSVHPTSATAGSIVTVSGEGFLPGSPYKVSWNVTTVLCSSTASMNGEFTCLFTVPSVAPGNYSLSATQGTSSPSVVFTVAKPPSPPPTSSGSSPYPWWIFALIVAGAIAALLFLFFVYGRRRPSPSRRITPWSGGPEAPAPPPWSPAEVSVAARPEDEGAPSPPSASPGVRAEPLPLHEPTEDVDALLARLDRIAEEVFKRKPPSDVGAVAGETNGGKAA